jgi:hypothetical protein
MKPEKIYKFQCGNIGPAKIVRRRKGCPECGAKLVGVLSVCKKCGVEFFGSLGRPKKFCSQCEDIVRAEQRYQRGKRLLSSKENKAKKDRDRKIKMLGIIEVARLREERKNMRTDCMFFKHCLKFDLKKDLNACVGCLNYTSIVLKNYPLTRKKSGPNPLRGQK